ncbi:hypothetical protein B9Z19DRAFT_1123632 [Tuber borchii]|uniref:Uncharacterized protein n=1 Tax=Tuber borchii TaxID=42251 RepID=A0A2T6ZXZ5_TUBBO|nr:hypothetical protein B9Z19DRAFT_1123632 [Tuber borchii]
MLKFLKVQKIDIQPLMVEMSLEHVKEKLVEIIQECGKQNEAKRRPVEFQIGIVTIPHNGIDVPFLYTSPGSGVKPFKKFLMKKIDKRSVVSYGWLFTSEICGAVCAVLLWL